MPKSMTESVLCTLITGTDYCFKICDTLPFSSVLLNMYYPIKLYLLKVHYVYTDSSYFSLFEFVFSKSVTTKSAVTISTRKSDVA